MRGTRANAEYHNGSAKHDLHGHSPPGGLVERLAEINFTVQRKLATKNPDGNPMSVACSVE
jgi:hypothetical protein